MPLQKLQFRPGVNREGTSLSNEGGYFECDKIRFRSGYPEKIGGWAAVSFNVFLGVCRSLWNWITLSSYNLVGVGTNLKFYIEDIGGQYYDITPVRTTTGYAGIGGTITFTATPGSSSIIVDDQLGVAGARTGDFVTFSGALGLNSQAFTVTIASPAVLTLTTALANNTPVTLTTTGALPTGLTVGTTYYVVNVSGLTCNLSIGPNGSPLNTTGTQSGTHTLSVAAGISTAVLNQQYQITNIYTVGATTYYTFNAREAGTTVEAPGAAVVALTTDTGTGGPYTTATYQINVGSAIYTSGTGWSAGPWSRGTWGSGYSAGIADQIRLWSQANFGENLLISPRTGALYIWQPGPTNPAYTTPAQLINGAQGITISIGTPAVITLTTPLPNGTPFKLRTTGALPTGVNTTTTYYVVNLTGNTCNLSTTVGGAAINTTGTQSGIQILAVPDVPSKINTILVSDSTRIVICFGCNDYGDYDTTVQDPLLIRWSTNESYLLWTPSTTNQAGSYRLSHGSYIVGALQTRQEILVWTDSAVYSMQYQGPPYVYGFNILADNISLAGPNAAATANGITYWMGVDKFYVYSGRVETLPCTLRQYVFEDFNKDQAFQCTGGSNEAYSEIWWFYPSITGSDGTGTRANPNTVVDRYVIYNYLDGVWYYGKLGRTAWIDSTTRNYPLAATYGNILVEHENGVDDGSTLPATAINAFVQSSDYDINDGHDYGFVWRIVPDITFNGSTVNAPSAKFIIKPRKNPGAPYGVTDEPVVTSLENYTNVNTYNVQTFTQQIYTRLRGRQMAFRVESNTLGTQWQLGVPRMDVRPDGRRA